MTLWILVRFFTILTNCLIACLFGAFALGWRGRAAPTLVGGTTLAIILVGLVYWSLLQGLHHLSGAAEVADLLLHGVTPLLAPLWWIIFAPRGRLRARDPWLWALWPLAYLAYALLRGTAEGVFAYPFLDYIAKGWPYVLTYVAVMAGGFVLFGHALLWLDRRMAA